MAVDLRLLPVSEIIRHEHWRASSGGRRIADGRVCPSVVSATFRELPMVQQASERNPFLLMVSPEVVLAAVEKSERLGQLNRHLCRPLDRQGLSATKPGTAIDDEDEVGNESEVGSD
jgi:hypothetical protein